MNDLGRRAVAAADPDFLAGEERRLAIVVHASAIDICAIDGREYPGVAPAHEDVDDRLRVNDHDVASLLEGAARRGLRDDAEGLWPRWRVVAALERSVGIDGHGEVVDRKARDRTIDAPAHEHRDVGQRDAGSRLID